MVKASYVAEVALRGKYIGTPYNRIDCQALIEKLLTDAGVKHPNWRGSNHMWREAVRDKFELNDDNRMSLPAGTWVFTVKNDRGETKRGYHDSEGNACHVGMYIGNGRVIHSTTGGVQWDTIYSRRWTHAGYCKLIDYGDNANENHAISADEYYEKLSTAFENLKEVLNEWPF